MLPSMLEIGERFSAGPLAVQQILTGYMIPFAIMSLWHGAISDALGRRRVILFGLAGYGLAAIGCALAPSLSSLIFWRVVQGTVAGAGSVVGRAMVRDFYTGAAAQRLMATVSVVFAIAPCIGPFVGGWLHVWLGWRAGFGFLALIAALLFAWVWLSLPETLPRSQRHSLHPGFLLRSYARVLGNPAFVAVTLALALNFCGFFIYVMSAPVFLVQHLGLAETDFLWLFAQSSLGMMAGAWMSRRAAGRVDRWQTAFRGYCIMGSAVAANLVLHSLAPASIPWSIVPIFFYVAGQSLIMPSLTLTALDLFPSQRGLASSCQTFLQSVGGALGASLLAPFVWHTPLSLAITQAVLAASGLFLALFARSLLAKHPEPTPSDADLLTEPRTP
jgi:DHA1 family bicyclomycin/chloramphenicol resistance-like MFS transporter